MSHDPEMTRGYGRQWLDDDDRAAVQAVLDGPFLTQGPRVGEFEAALCQATGAKYAVAVSSGTAALHLACLAAGVGAGDRVATQDITFVASANAGHYCGADVALTDVDASSIAMTPDQVDGDFKAVIPVHFAGYSVLDAALKAKTGAAVIEDACHALGGADAEGRPIGACAHSDMAVFSFHPVKSVTTGEGGAITTNDEGLAEKLMLLRNHGLVREAEAWQDPNQGLDGDAPNPWYYEQHALGFNFRMTELQAALGISQMQKLDMFMDRRRALALAYVERLDGVANVHALHDADAIGRSANHLFVAMIDFAAVGKSRRDVMELLRARDVGTQVHYIPVHRQPFHAKHVPAGQSFPNADAYYEHCLSLPLHPGMSVDDVDHVVAALKEVLSGS